MKHFLLFFLVGGGGFVADLLVFSVSGPWLGYYTAKVLGFIFAVQFTFLLNKNITFKNQQASYWFYLAGQSKGFLLNFMAFSVAYRVLAQITLFVELISFIFASAMTMLFNYFYATKLVFKPATPKEIS